MNEPIIYRPSEPIISDICCIKDPCQPCPGLKLRYPSSRPKCPILPCTPWIDNQPKKACLPRKPCPLSYCEPFWPCPSCQTVKGEYVSIYPPVQQMKQLRQRCCEEIAYKMGLYPYSFCYCPPTKEILKANKYSTRVPGIEYCPEFEYKETL